MPMTPTEANEMLEMSSAVRADDRAIRRVRSIAERLEREGQAALAHELFEALWLGRTREPADPEHPTVHHQMPS
ncbi:MAG: hypothetical protein NVSMB59_23150 [Vulcanimicrobiaceae bacterium]